jgi:hypothetical protein
MAGSMKRSMNLLLAAPILLAMVPGCTDPYDASPSTDGSSAQASATSRAGVLAVTLEAPDADVSRFQCVFVMGRRGPDANFPELVKRLPAGPFPLTFELTARDLMGVGSLRGEWHISARLDHDGDAPFAKGDLQGESVANVGGEGAAVTVTMDTLVEEDAPPTAALDTSMGAHGGATASMPAGHGGVDPHAGHNHGPGEHVEDPHAGHDHAPGEHGLEPSASEAAAPDDGLTMLVSVRLGDDVVAAPSGDLYLFARASATGQGMPLAVKRVPGPSFPSELTIGLNDMPIAYDNAAELLSGEVWLSATLDLDGNATTKDPNDLVGGPLLASREGTSVLTLSPRGTP